MKIAIVSPLMLPVPPKKYGGIEVIVDYLGRGLAERGHKVTVFCSGDSSIKGEGLQRIETTPYPTGNNLAENRQWEVAQFLTVLSRQKDFDVIHFNYEPVILRFNIEGTTFNLLDFFEVPVVLTFHNVTDIPANIEYYRQTLSLYRHMMVFISKNQQKPLSFFPNSKVIYNAISLEKFPFETEKENYLLFLGRIAPFKGILEAISVARKTNIPLIIVAKVDPTDQEFYEKEVKEKIDGKLIRYVGEADFNQKVNYLKKARCLLFPILWEEPFGLVMIEALACGTPVVAFKAGSVPEIIHHGVNGLVVDNVEEMAKAVFDVENISAERCRESVEKNFFLERMINEYENLFRDVSKVK